ncbi:MAG: histidine phosphotransferase family protein, partial [Paracoccaceae bacterium]
MTRSATHLAALVTSRLCHDLVSPVGAINNGLELLDLSGGDQSGPEMALIRDSVEAASARIKFFRMAFGHFDAGQHVAMRDVQQTLSALNKEARVKTHWAQTDSIPRHDAQLGFLAALCIQLALPRGGTCHITSHSTGGLTITGTGTHIQYDSDLWDRLAAGGHMDVTPAQVQFALLPLLAEQAGYALIIGTTP